MLLRAQGRAVWRRFNEALASGRMPHREVMDGVLVIFGGAFLITPGFLTDIVGLVLLLPPTRCYLDEVRSLRARADVRALAHVTGGGIAGNLARVLPEGVGAVIDAGSWGRPAVFAWLAEHGVPEDELRRVFNIGIGYCAVVPAAHVEPSDVVIGRLEAGVDGVAWSDA